VHPIGPLAELSRIIETNKFHFTGFCLACYIAGAGSLAGTYRKSIQGTKQRNNHPFPSNDILFSLTDVIIRLLKIIQGIFFFC